jgi:hypothetical protein
LDPVDVAVAVLLQVAAEFVGIRREASSVAVETRIDPADNQPYRIESFIEVYGVDEGIARWESCSRRGA